MCCVQVVFGPTEEDFTAGHSGFQLHLRLGDVIVPMCHEGVNRSQVVLGVVGMAGACPSFTAAPPPPQIMFLAGIIIKRSADGCVPGEERVTLPHGAESAYDPYQGYSGLNEDNIYEYTLNVIRPFGSEGEWVRSVPFPDCCAPACANRTRGPRLPRCRVQCWDAPKPYVLCSLCRFIRASTTHLAFRSRHALARYPHRRRACFQPSARPVIAVPHHVRRRTVKRTTTL